MRIRHKPYARPELAAWPHHVNNPQNTKGCWQKNFANTHLPLRIELGCGKGSFLAHRALRETDFNYVGVDIKSEMLVVAKRNIEHIFHQANQAQNNLMISTYNIEHIQNIFSSEDDVRRLYINFCNPWYKSGHAKHRLTHPRQLIQYRNFLHPEAELHFKTDDSLLFEDSLRYFSLCAFEVVWQSRDLHKEEPSWNIRTEHEQMFSEKGVPIKACILRMQKASLDEDHLRRCKDI